MQLDAICGDKSALLSSCLDIAELERQGAWIAHQACSGARTAAAAQRPRNRQPHSFDSLDLVRLLRLSSRLRF
jgi:hypothetical protein